MAVCTCLKQCKCTWNNVGVSGDLWSNVLWNNGLLWNSVCCGMLWNCCGLLWNRCGTVFAVECCGIAVDCCGIAVECCKIAVDCCGIAVAIDRENQTCGTVYDCSGDVFHISHIPPQLYTVAMSVFVS